MLLGPPTAAEPAPVTSPPPPTLTEPPVPASPVPERTPVLRRCLAEVEPCYRSGGARLLLAGFGLLTSAGAIALVFVGGDRQGIGGDPAPALAAFGTIAMGAATIGGIAGWAGLDGPAIPDRITPATIGLGLGLGGSTVSDETLPYSMSGSVAPTWQFPRDLGRLRLLARVGGQLGAQTERDPRPQASSDDGSFGLASTTSTWTANLGLDLALRLPYPLAPPKTTGLGRFELRYKPLVSIARTRLELVDDARISERVALMPLNFGFRWIVSPRQRFTAYLGPRWDLDNYGEPGALVRDQPSRAPIYGEAWFDIDVPLQRSGATRRVAAVGQFTVGYVHSRFFGWGMNFGAVTGFLGHVVAQFATRIRPRDSPVAYQLELGARVGNGLNPFVRFGIVLPDIGGDRR